MVYVSSKGPRSDCLLADMKQIDQTKKVIRHLAPLDDFFFIWVLRPFQEYFTYIEPIKGDRKPENPGKPPDLP